MTEDNTGPAENGSTGTFKLYIDGAFQGQGFSKTSFNGANGLLNSTTVGFANLYNRAVSNGAGLTLFKGIMDDIRIYKKVLSQEEINALKNE